MIGTKLFSYLQSQGKSLCGTTRRRDTVSEFRLLFDLGTLEGLAKLPEAEVVYIVAAMARLEDCKQNPIPSRKVNVDAVKAIRDRFTGAFIIFLSTDKVFNGQEPLVPPDQLKDPQTEYGRQKAVAEEIVKKYANSAIVRLTKVFGKEIGLFKNWSSKLKAGEEIHPFSDMTMAPVKVENVCECLSTIAEKKFPGIYQLSGDKDISYADAAYIGAKTLKLDETLIKPIKTAESGIFSETPPTHASLKASAELPDMPVDTETVIKEFFILEKVCCEYKKL